jgi:acetoin utilization protein AcuB
MTKEVITVNEDTPIENAARIMVDNRIGGLLVVNSENSVEGIITETDSFKTFLELIGACKPGVRITLIARDERGGPARLAKAVADIGGNIVASVEVPGTDSTNYEVLMKVTGVTKKALVEDVQPVAVRIIDERED